MLLMLLQVAGILGVAAPRRVRGGSTADAVAEMVKQASPGDGGVAVVASLGGVASHQRAAMLDQALGTDFSSDAQSEDYEGPPVAVARAVEIGGRAALALDCGPADVAGATAGFAASCAHVVVLCAWRSEIGRGVALNADVFRALRDTCRAKGRKISLVVAVHDEFGYSRDDEEQAVLADVKAACGDAGSFCSSIDVVADAEALVKALAERCATADGLFGDVPRAVKAAWDESRTSVAVGDVAAFVCDSAASRCRELAQAAHARWRRDVDDGRLAPRGWASECSELSRAILARYDAETLGYWTFGGRAEKRDALQTFITDEARRCHLKQLETATTRHLRRLKARLEKAAAANPRGDLDPSDADRLVSDAEFDFDVDATRCEVPALDLLATDRRVSFRDSARRLAADFAETPAAQLLATRAEERRAAAATRASKKPAAPKQQQQQQKKTLKKAPALSYALQLVGMLRPRGYGNLQGFCNYAIGPHSILFGYSDDRDTGGDMSTSDDVPLLRLQPKLTLDVDL